MRRVLLTGPANRTAPWIDAARAAGWEPLVRELLVIESCAFALARDPELVVVASANALPALEAHRDRLRPARHACVGATTANVLGSWGLAAAIPAAIDRASLVRDLARCLAPGTRVLAPRGDRSEELARDLRALGADVEAPIVYRVRERVLDAPLPATDAILFASPSCVDAWSRALRGPGRPAPTAIAMGASTAEALVERRALDPAALGPILVLERPEPAALTALLWSHRPES